MNTRTNPTQKGLVMTRKSEPTRKPNRQQAATSRPTNRWSWWSWAAIGIPVIALVALMVFGGGDDTSSDAAIGSQAPAFDLVATDGSRETLETALADGDALLYFSMGPGCDGCFLQIPEIADALADDDITLIPVMVDPAPRVAAEAERFGITMPILIDADRSLSRAYNMIGIYGHQDRPSHSFALVNQDREITWVKHYAEMFVPFEQLVADMREPI